MYTWGSMRVCGSERTWLGAERAGPSRGTTSTGGGARTVLTWAQPCAERVNKWGSEWGRPTFEATSKCDQCMEHAGMLQYSEVECVVVANEPRGVVYGWRMSYKDEDDEEE